MGEVHPNDIHSYFASGEPAECSSHVGYLMSGPGPPNTPGETPRKRLLSGCVNMHVLTSPSPKHHMHVASVARPPISGLESLLLTQPFVYGRIVRF